MSTNQKTTLNNRRYIKVGRKKETNYMQVKEKSYV